MNLPIRPVLLSVKTLRYVFEQAVSVLNIDKEYARTAISVLFRMNYLTCQLYYSSLDNPPSFKKEYSSTQKQIEEFTIQFVHITPFNPLFFSCYLLDIFRNISVIDIREAGELTPEFHHYHLWLLDVMSEASRLYAKNH